MMAATADLPRCWASLATSTGQLKNDERSSQLTASFARISLRPNSDHRRQLLLCRWGHGTEAIPGVYRCDDHKRSQTCCVGRTVIDFDRSLAKSSLRSGYRHWPVRPGRCCHSLRCALEQPRIPRAITTAPAAFSFETSTIGPSETSLVHRAMSEFESEAESSARTEFFTG
jgi:hypothetical protein